MSWSSPVEPRGLAVQSFRLAPIGRPTDRGDRHRSRPRPSLAGFTNEIRRRTGAHRSPPRRANPPCGDQGIRKFAVETKCSSFCWCGRRAQPSCVWHSRCQPSVDGRRSNHKIACLNLYPGRSAFRGWRKGATSPKGIRLRFRMLLGRQ